MTMKKFLTTLAMMAIIALPLSAQKNIMPQYTGEVALLNADSTITTLEKTPCQMKATGSLTGGKASLVMEGIASKVRVTHGKDIRIVVRMGNNSYAPDQFVKVYKLNIKKKKYREAIMTRIKTFSSIPTDDGNISYESEQYGKECYVITLKDLPVGEYAVQVINLTALYCFGIE